MGLSQSKHGDKHHVPSEEYDQARKSLFFGRSRTQHEEWLRFKREFILVSPQDILDRWSRDGGTLIQDHIFMHLRDLGTRLEILVHAFCRQAQEMSSDVAVVSGHVAKKDGRSVAKFRTREPHGLCPGETVSLSGMTVGKADTQTLIRATGHEVVEVDRESFTINLDCKAGSISTQPKGQSKATRFSLKVGKRGFLELMNHGALSGGDGWPKPGSKLGDRLFQVASVLDVTRSTVFFYEFVAAWGFLSSQVRMNSSGNPLGALCEYLFFVFDCDEDYRLSHVEFCAMMHEVIRLVGQRPYGLQEVHSDSDASKQSFEALCNLPPDQCRLAVFQFVDSVFEKARMEGDAKLRLSVRLPTKSRASKIKDLARAIDSASMRKVTLEPKLVDMQGKETVVPQGMDLILVKGRPTFRELGAEKVDEPLKILQVLEKSTSQEAELTFSSERLDWDTWRQWLAELHAFPVNSDTLEGKGRSHSKHFVDDSEASSNDDCNEHGEPRTILLVVGQTVGNFRGMTVQVEAGPDDTIEHWLQKHQEHPYLRVEHETMRAVWEVEVTKKEAQPSQRIGDIWRSAGIHANEKLILFQTEREKVSYKK
mmetsp:Transcript_30105/g.68192  ORF Transcript_30105/g.68192 Transcript_30105/m.68192 type:complete len:594 (+) Transcript_30105:13-1794(+)